MEALEKEDKKDSGCDVEMEEGSQASDRDSDETVVEGSVTESEPEEEALPWRRWPPLDRGPGGGWPSEIWGGGVPRQTASGGSRPVGRPGLS